MCYLFSIFIFQEYFRLRSAAVQNLKDVGQNPYPHKFHVSISLEEFIEKYSNLKDGEVLADAELSVAGKTSYK